jgi:predicted cupin superfamily sugar epimerase
VTAEQIIQRLGLKPHPREKGFFVETYRSPEKLTWESLSARYDGTRSCSTAIYFLLTQGGFSELHRLKSDEIFHFYSGSAAELLLLYPDGEGQLIRFGYDLQNEERPQIVIPAGCWQGMKTTGEYTLFGCTVSPGFEYSDYEQGERAFLMEKYPQFAETIIQLTENKNSLGLDR